MACVVHRRGRSWATLGCNFLQYNTQMGYTSLDLLGWAYHSETIAYLTFAILVSRFVPHAFLQFIAHGLPVTVHCSRLTVHRYAESSVECRTIAVSCASHDRTTGRLYYGLQTSEVGGRRPEKS